MIQVNHKALLTTDHYKKYGPKPGDQRGPYKQNLL